MVNLLRASSILTNKRIKAQVSPRYNWYCNEDMLDIFLKERNRFTRSGLGLSYVIIDLTTYLDDDTLLPDELYISFLEKLLEVINENTRNYDIKFLLNPFKIGILLVDTCLGSAKIFIQKISDISYRSCSENGHKELLQIIESVKISTYPVTTREPCTQVEGYPVMLKKVMLVNGQPQSDGNFNIYNPGEPDFIIDWNLKVRSNGTMAIGTPDFWSIFHLPIHKTTYRICKRFMDIVGSVIALIIAAPIMIIIGFLIKLTSAGPALFKQERLGHLGKPFQFLKFRSMKLSADDQIHREYVAKLIAGKSDEVNLGSKEFPVFKITDDPRITTIGWFIRRTSLDELPQFFNVLMGDMSLVGPRPPIPYEIKSYKNWHLRRILDIKPGITGLWQVNGRSKTTFDEMVRLDLQYVSHCNLWLDIKILFKTISAIFNLKGAF